MIERKFEKYLQLFLEEKSDKVMQNIEELILE